MNFVKTFLAALLAIIVANILVGILAVMILAGMVAAVRTTPTTSPNSVLRIDFTHGVTDAPDNSLFQATGLLGDGIKINSTNSLRQVLEAIENASYDDHIKGVYINVTGGSISMANVEEVRAALQKFREESGKFVIAYSEVYSQLGYYFASVADKVYIHPEGSVNWQGLASQVMFYKGTLEKLGVEVEILRQGAFKAAVEPFMREGMSPENRMQLNTVLGSVWGMILDDISASRGISREQLSEYATDLALSDADDALRCGFVDAILYEDQVDELLARLATSQGAEIDTELGYVLQREADAVNVAAAAPVSDDSGEEPAEDVAEVDEPVRNSVGDSPVAPPVMININDYIEATSLHGVGHRGDRIAIVYIDGDIVDGAGTVGSVGGADVAAKLARTRRDPRVKGVVVRVNSPGGSALASDVMWREMELLRREKPVVVSMGGYAASGGYYVSCPADLILADRSTLTGSIGVFGIVPNAGKALKDILGITTDVAKTNEHADMGSMLRPLGSTERDHLQKGVEQVYRTFVGHVASGRNLTVERVDEIGGGRVWSGANAVEIGLVDGIGGLNEAIELCADRAGISGSYRITEVVDELDTISALLRSMSSSVRAEAALRSELGEVFVQYRKLQNILGQSGVQARMPYEIDIR